MSGFLTLGLCAGLLASQPPADGAGLAVVKQEARELQRAGRYDDARQRLARFADRVPDEATHAEVERLVARYGALDHAWQRAQEDPRENGRTFISVLVAGGRWVPATDEDIERAVCTLARADDEMSRAAAATYHLDVQFPGADAPTFERALKERLARCHLRLDSGRSSLALAQQMERDRQGRVGGRTLVSVDGRRSVEANTWWSPIRTATLHRPASLPAAALGDMAAVRVMERVLLDVHHGRL